MTLHVFGMAKESREDSGGTKATEIVDLTIVIQYSSDASDVFERKKSQQGLNIHLFH